MIVCGTDSVEDGVEVVVADEEGAVLRMEVVGVVVVERDAVCHLDRHEVTDVPWWVHAEDRREKPRRTDLVSARDDDVVQLDRHRHLVRSARPETTGYRWYRLSYLAAVASISTLSSGNASLVTPMRVIAGRLSPSNSVADPKVASSSSTSVV